MRGSKGSAVVRPLASHLCVRILASTRYVGLWVEFVLGSLPCSERFFCGYSGFPLSSKTNTFKFQFDLERTDTFQRVLYERKCSVGKQITFINEGTNKQTKE